MKQLYQKTITVSILALMSIPTLAYDCEVDGIYYILGEDRQSNKVAQVTYKDNNYNSYSGTVRIPSSITYKDETYKVISILSYAFLNCTEPTSITIDNGVEWFSSSAFRNCTGLTSITIPSSVTQIGNSAFYGCSSLTSINIPSSVTQIGYSAFYGCSSLTSINIPSSVTQIGNSAFYGCSSLTSINIPSSVTQIGTRAFRGCTGLTSITIPSSVTQIGDEAFYRCSSLTSINIPSSVTQIGNSAFYNTGLNSVLIPNSVTFIGGYNFNDWSNYTRVDGYWRWIEHKCVIICTNETPPTTNSDGSFSRKKVIVPASAIETYKSTKGWTEAYFNEGIEVVNTTQSTASITTGGLISDVNTSHNGDTFYSNNDTITVTGLNPNTNYSFSLKYKDVDLKIKLDATTKSVNPDIEIDEITYSTVKLTGKDNAGDAKVNSHGFVGYEGQGDDITVSGLQPGKEYTFTYYVVVSGGERFETKKTVKTLDITPSIAIKTISNTTITLTGDKGMENGSEETVTEHGFVGYENQGDSITITGLAPGKEYTFTYYVVTTDGSRFTVDKTITTNRIEVNATATSGPSHLIVTGSYENEDATLTEYGFEGYENTDSVALYGLDPETEYTFTFYVVTEEGGKQTQDFTFKTDKLTMDMLDPKTVKLGEVVVAAQTNLDDKETNVGFEWKREDWGDKFRPKTGGGIIYQGTIEGSIRDLNTDKLWLVKPYYLSGSGTYHYGEEIGIDPSDVSYFDPVVHTADNAEVSENSAMVQGYVINGSDNVTAQGMEYWKEEDGQSQSTTVETGGGQVMTASLTNLDYETTYDYVAFATTTSGQTYYGEIKKFKTGKKTSDNKGDVNSDGNVDISDIVAVINHIAGTNNYNQADVNGDTKVDISDIVAIINIIAGN